MKMKKMKSKIKKISISELSKKSAIEQMKDKINEDRLKILIESAFKDVIEKKAKEILIETFRRKKGQSE